MKPNKDPPVKVDWGKHAKPFGKRHFHKRVRRKVRDRLNKLRKEGTE